MNVSEYSPALDSVSPELAAGLESGTDEQRDAVVYVAVKCALEAARISNPTLSEVHDALRERKSVPAAIVDRLKAMAVEADRDYAEALAPEDSGDPDSPAADDLFHRREALEAIANASQGHRALAISAALTATGMHPDGIARLVALL